MQKQTSRQLQAQKTKNKIYNAAVSLFKRQGFDNTTIEEISHKAGVSVGAFYHYYPSKSHIYSELYRKIDEFFEDTVQSLMEQEYFYDNILLFFKHYAAYNTARGVDDVKQLYSTESILFLDKSRYMLKLLQDVLSQGKEKRQLNNAMTVEEIEEFLLICARGVVYDWVLHKGSYDLEAKMEQYISQLKPVFTEHTNSL